MWLKAPFRFVSFEFAALSLYRWLRIVYSDLVRLDHRAAVPIGACGCVLICLGSGVAALVPGDGQTGIVAFPLIGLGGFFGISALSHIRNPQLSLQDRATIAVFASMAVIALGVSVLVSMLYVPPHRR